MAQYRKDVFNLAAGPGQAIDDPRVAEDLGRSADARAWQALALQRQSQAQQQALAMRQLRLQEDVAAASAAANAGARSAQQQALQDALDRLGKPKSWSDGVTMGVARDQDPNRKQGFAASLGNGGIPSLDPRGNLQPTILNADPALANGRYADAGQGAQATQAFMASMLANSLGYTPTAQGMDEQRTAREAMERALGFEAQEGSAERLSREKIANLGIDLQRMQQQDLERARGFEAQEGAAERLSREKIAGMGLELQRLQQQAEATRMDQDAAQQRLGLVQGLKPEVKALLDNFNPDWATSRDFRGLMPLIEGLGPEHQRAAFELLAPYARQGTNVPGAWWRPESAPRPTGGGPQDALTTLGEDAVGYLLGPFRRNPALEGLAGDPNESFSFKDFGLLGAPGLLLETLPKVLASAGLIDSEAAVRAQQQAAIQRILGGVARPFDAGLVPSPATQVLGGQSLDPALSGALGREPIPPVGEAPQKPYSRLRDRFPSPSPSPTGPVAPPPPSMAASGLSPQLMALLIAMGQQGTPLQPEAPPPPPPPRSTGPAVRRGMSTR